MFSSVTLKAKMEFTSLSKLQSTKKRVEGLLE